MAHARMIVLLGMGGLVSCVVTVMMLGRAAKDGPAPLAPVSLRHVRRDADGRIRRHAVVLEEAGHKGQALATVSESLDPPPPAQLPEQPGHPILSLSDDAFHTTDHNAYLDAYGPTEGTFQGHSCENDFGKAWIERWRDRRETYCEPLATGGSKIDCFLLQQTRHAGAGDNLCLMENVVLDFGRFYGDADLVGSVMQRHVETRLDSMAYIAWQPGFIRGSCAVQRPAWNPRHFPGWNKEFLHDGFEEAPGLRVAPDSPDCDVYIEHPVILIQRDGYANFFHGSEDFFNLYTALLILRWTIGDAQVFLTDLYPEGSFWPVWNQVFGQRRKPMTAWSIKETYGARKVCFRQAAVGILGAAAAITLCSFDIPCRHSSVVRAYSDVFLRGLDLQGVALRSAPEARLRNRVVVTFMARRPTADFPAKAHCDDKFFRCELFERLGKRSLQRMVRNEDALLAKLEKLSEEDFANSANVEVRAVDYNLMSFEEQIRTDVETDIMVGPHGAGLQHSLYMRDRGTLVELFVDGSAANRHFHNMAAWHGRPYEGVSMGNPVPIEKVYDVVRGAIDALDLAAY